MKTISRLGLSLFKYTAIFVVRLKLLKTLQELGVKLTAIDSWLFKWLKSEILVNSFVYRTIENNKKSRNSHVIINLFDNIKSQQKKQLIVNTKTTDRESDKIHTRYTCNNKQKWINKHDCVKKNKYLWTINI